MIDVLRIAHLRIAPQEGNSEVGNCEVHLALRGGGECWCFDKLLAQACSHFEREPIEDCEHFVYSHFNQLANNIFLHEHLIK